MELQAKRQELDELRRRAAALEREIVAAEAATTQWPPQEFYGMYYATSGFLLGGWLPGTDGSDPMHGWALSYLHVGGLLVPALFMLAEYAFRRWYLRHVPHMPPQQFFRRLMQNWPQLLHDREAIPGRGARHAG